MRWAIDFFYLFVFVYSNRYLGPTEFAPGTWAGIEIYGRSVRNGNDGSVQGTR